MNITIHLLTYSKKIWIMHQSLFDQAFLVERSFPSFSGIPNIAKGETVDVEEINPKITGQKCIVQPNDW